MKTSDHSYRFLVVEVEDPVGKPVDRRSSQIPMHARKLIWVVRDTLQDFVERFYEDTSQTAALRVIPMSCLFDVVGSCGADDK